MYSKLIQEMLGISPAVYSYRKKNKAWTAQDLLKIQEKLKQKGIEVTLEQVTEEYLRF